MVICDIVNRPAFSPERPSSRPLIVLGENVIEILLIIVHVDRYPVAYLPTTWADYNASVLRTLSRRGFSPAATEAVLVQYSPARYLTDPATGEPYYRAAYTQLNGDMGFVCPTIALHQKLGQLGKTAFLYHFDYGPSCSDVAGHAWGDASPYAAAGGMASHTAEIDYVFGTVIPAGLQARPVPMVDPTALECNPMLEERFSRGSSARLTTAMQQFWTSFAKTGVPTADASLVSSYGGVQWPAGDGAASGGPVMVLGETIGIVPGRKDADCAVLQQPTDDGGGVPTEVDGPASEGKPPVNVPADNGGVCYVCVLACIGVFIAVGAGCKRKLVAKGGGGDSIYAAGAAAPASDAANGGAAN